MTDTNTEPVSTSPATSTDSDVTESASDGRSETIDALESAAAVEGGDAVVQGSDPVDDSGDVSDAVAVADDDIDLDLDDASDSADDAAASGAGPATSGKAARLEREGEIAADYLETLLDIADLDGDLEVDVDGDRAAVSIVDSDDGRAPRSLVGQHGKVLEALQELSRLAVQAETGDRSRLMLDIAGHRSTRRTQLVSLAQDAVEQVRSTGKPQRLEPMSAFERKVVHDAVLKAGLGSESEGAEPNRRVVVLPA